MKAMTRRELMTLFAGVAGFPAVAIAQPPRPARVGFLIAHSAAEPFATLLKQGLSELGYVEGKNLQLDVRVAEDPKVLATLAAEFVTQHVDVIATVRASATEAAKQATKDIPIVIALAADAVALGLVSSLAKPGGNVTGVSANTADTAAKTLEVLHEMLPAARRIAALVDAQTTFGDRFLARVEQTGKVLGLEIHGFRIRGGAALAAALPGISRARPHAAILQPSLGAAAAERMLGQRIAAVSPNSTLASGCVMTYSAHIPDMFRKAARYIDRVLKGAKPAELPVEQPTSFELWINQRAARSLGIAVPQAVLVRADKVID